MRFEIQFSGHENIRSNHQKTIEITKESHLNQNGYCIIGFNANASCEYLPYSNKKKLKKKKKKIKFKIKIVLNKIIF
jgi:hypothetical protein